MAGRGDEARTPGAPRGRNTRARVKWGTPSRGRRQSRISPMTTARLAPGFTGLYRYRGKPQGRRRGEASAHQVTKMAARRRPKRRWTQALAAAHAHRVVRMSRSGGVPGIVMFAQSHAYEPFMGRWSRRLAPLFVEFAGVQDGESVLDVGSGTGALAVRDPRGAAQGARHRRRSGAGLRRRRRASGRRGGASASSSATREALDFSDGTFDRAVSLLALNFVPDPAQALAEQIRVTRPGGLVAAAVWDYGDGMQMLRAFWDEAVAADPAAERARRAPPALVPAQPALRAVAVAGHARGGRAAADDRAALRVVRGLLEPVPRRPGAGGRLRRQPVASRPHALGRPPASSPGRRARQRRWSVRA